MKRHTYQPSPAFVVTIDVNGAPHEVTIAIDANSLAYMMAPRALRTQRGVAILADGRITVTAVPQGGQS